jgi:hypothetical protein
MSSFDKDGTYKEVEYQDGRYDRLNDTLSGFVDKITYTGYDNDGIDGNNLGYAVNATDGYMSDYVQDVVIIDDASKDPEKRTFYSTYKEVLNQIFTRQHETLVLKVTCKLGYWLDTYELMNSSGNSIFEKNVNTYQVTNIDTYAIGADGIVKTNQHEITGRAQDQHTDSELKYHYVIHLLFLLTCYHTTTLHNQLL